MIFETSNPGTCITKTQRWPELILIASNVYKAGQMKVENQKSAKEFYNTGPFWFVDEVTEKVFSSRC